MSEESREPRVALTDTQLVIAREHGFESWPKFAAHIMTANLERSVASLDDPVAAFIRAACVHARNDAHISGTLEEAELILAQYPQVRACQRLYSESDSRADEAAVRSFLAGNATSATKTGGSYGWDALTHLCFSPLSAHRPGAVPTPLFSALRALSWMRGASANTGWYEMIDHPNPRPVLESAIYGAAGIAQHEGVTRLLLEYGADPND